MHGSNKVCFLVGVIFSCAIFCVGEGRGIDSYENCLQVYF